MPRTITCALTLLLVIATNTSCNEREKTSSTTRQAQQKLVGMWNVRFEATSAQPSGLASSPAMGIMAFVRRTTTADIEDLDGATHAGVANVDLRTLGAELPDPPHSMAVAARVSDRESQHDSLTVLLGAGDNRRGIWMRGAWSDDSIAGTWTLLDARLYGARGRFVLTRWNATAAHE